jgi:hypothetical protein
MKEKQIFARCRVCGQLLKAGVEKCPYCGGGTYKDSDRTLKKPAHAVQAKPVLPENKGAMSPKGKKK